MAVRVVWLLDCMAVGLCELLGLYNCRGVWL